MKFLEFCIFTIRNLDALNKAFHNGKQGEFKEGKIWRTSKKLLNNAKKKGVIFPIIFSDAADVGKLYYWAKIDDIAINDNDKSTRYKFSILTRIEGNYNKTDLILKNKKRKISQDYIRGYAICEIPKFLKPA